MYVLNASIYILRLWHDPSKNKSSSLKIFSLPLSMLRCEEVSAASGLILMTVTLHKAKCEDICHVAKYL